MTAHGDDEVRRHKGCRTFLLRPRAPRPSDPELPHAEANLPTRYPTHRKQRGGKDSRADSKTRVDRWPRSAWVAATIESQQNLDNPLPCRGPHQSSRGSQLYV